MLFDAETMKIEITAALIFSDERVFNDINNMIHPNDKGRIGLVDLNSREMKNFVKENLNIDHFLLAGAVALAEGIHLLEGSGRNQ